MLQSEGIHKSIWAQVRDFLHKKFNLDDDKASEEEVRANIRRGVDFQGTNLWILIFAIFIASIGLNVNSTAVIIGAMLVSPLMGPIMGVGLSLGVNNFDLMKRSIKNLAFATGVGLATSTLYFMISPLSGPQSELLARTTPTIYDVLIATFGGLAGIVAQTRRDRTSTVIPGVAIATALMPPLCTAGYGLAVGNINYFIGALYLYFINAVFIALGTFIIVRFLKYKKVEFADSRKEIRARRLMTLIVVVTLVPSIILAYGIVQRTIFETNAKSFVDKVLSFEGSEVVNTNIKYSHEGSIIEVMLVGKNVSQDAITLAQTQLETYKISNTQLIVRQASADNSFDSNTMQSVLRSNTQIIDEKNEIITNLQTSLNHLQRNALPSQEIARELSTLWGRDIAQVSITRSPLFTANGAAPDTTVICYITTHSGQPLDSTQKHKLTNWLKVRTNLPKVKLFID